MTPIRPATIRPRGMIPLRISSQDSFASFCKVPLNRTNPKTYPTNNATSVASGSFRYLNAANIPPIPIVITDAIPIRAAVP